MTHSLNKGKSFEREIAKILTQKTGADWLRVPMSGAYSTLNQSVRLSDDPRFKGDIFTEDIEYKNIVVECKSYNSLELNELFNSTSKVFGWIRQAQKESEPKDWILFIKINRKGIYYIVEDVNVVNKLKLASLDYNVLRFNLFIMGKLK